MAYSATKLPSRFPVGTKFVIEGRVGGDLSRFIEFPDGTKLRLPKRPTASGPARAARPDQGQARSLTDDRFWCRPIASVGQWMTLLSVKRR